MNGREKLRYGADKRRIEQALLHINEYTWEQAFDGVVREHEFCSNKTERYDLLQTYLELTHIGQAYISQNKMKEGESYDIPCDDGSALRVRVYKDSSSLSALADDQELELISRNDYAKQEYSKLDYYTFGPNKKEIGHSYPQAFVDMLSREMRPGRVVTFDGIDSAHQKAYVCMSDINFALRLKEVSLYAPQNITAKAFMQANEVFLHIGNKKEIQAFYNQVKSLTGCVFPRVEDIDTFAQQQINKLYTQVKPGQSAVLQYGGERLRVQQSLLGKKFKWFDKNGTRITEDAAKVFIAWCHNAPIIIDAKAVPKILAEPRKYEEYTKYEKAMLNKDYYAAADHLSKLCVGENRDFVVNLFTYRTQGEDSVPVAFCFKSTGAECKIYSVTYSNEPIPGEIKAITPVKRDDFAKFCEEKYKDVCRAIKGYYMQRYQQEIDRSVFDPVARERIVEDAAEKSLQNDIAAREVVRGELNNIPAEIDNIVQSYIDYPEDDNEIIYDEEIGMRCRDDDGDIEI